jgi:hypothetical protein
VLKARLASVLFLATVVLSYPLWILLRYFDIIIDETRIVRVIKENKEVF